MERSPFATRFRVRYAEIDGQKVVFNSRYLEYADVAMGEWWRWSGIGAALGETWEATEFHVRRAEVDYLRPFHWGDMVEGRVTLARIGGSSLSFAIELAHAETGALHARVTLVIVNVDLATHAAAPIGAEVRHYLERLTV